MAYSSQYFQDMVNPESQSSFLSLLTVLSDKMEINMEIPWTGTSTMSGIYSQDQCKEHFGRTMDRDSLVILYVTEAKLHQEQSNRKDHFRM